MIIQLLIDLSSKLRVVLLSNHSDQTGAGGRDNACLFGPLGLNEY